MTEALQLLLVKLEHMILPGSRVTLVTSSPGYTTPLSLGATCYTSIKNHFYKMKRDIGMADYEKQVKQEFHTPSLYLCFVIGA